MQRVTYLDYRVVKTYSIRQRERELTKLIRNLRPEDVEPKANDILATIADLVSAYQHSLELSKMGIFQLDMFVHLNLPASQREGRLDEPHKTS